VVVVVVVMVVVAVMVVVVAHRQDSQGRGCRLVRCVSHGACAVCASPRQRPWPPVVVVVGGGGSGNHG
jgi:hypothetical protein